VAYDEREQDVITETFGRMLKGVTADGGRKRLEGEKVPWWRDAEHKAAMFSHLARRERGETVDPDSGQHPYVHLAWRALAIAYQEIEGPRDPAGAPEWAVGEEEDDMCPNCVTPWKCNGPHEWSFDEGRSRRELFHGDVGPENPYSDPTIREQYTDYVEPDDWIDIPRRCCYDCNCSKAHDEAAREDRDDDERVPASGRDSRGTEDSWESHTPNRRRPNRSYARTERVWVGSDPNSPAPPATTRWIRRDWDGC